MGLTASFETEHVIVKTCIPSQSEMDEEDKRDMEELSKMLGSFTSFVEKKSGISGALFPG